MQRKTGAFEGSIRKNTVYRFLNSTKTNWKRFTTLLSIRIINNFMKPLNGNDREENIERKEKLYYLGKIRIVFFFKFW